MNISFPSDDENQGEYISIGASNIDHSLY
jgi:hypothetical protein